MSRKQQRVRIGATRGKLALIGVLALTLVFVIVRQLPSDQTVNVSANTTPSNLLEVVAQDTQTSKKQNQQPKKLPWPVVNLSKLLSNDPFSSPIWAEQENQKTIAKKAEFNGLANLQKQGASIVVIAEGQKTATIGDRRVHVGDVLEGYKITDITPQGIILDKLAPQ